MVEKKIKEKKEEKVKEVIKKEAVKKEETVKTVGRRKSASARVRMTLGTGKVVVNARPLNNYFSLKLCQENVMSPFVATSTEGRFDISAKVDGGGVISQADAVRHGIARALLEWDENLRSVLRAEGFLTRDPRIKERKKFGHTKARRGHQWKKR
jgi:small subunit ribosomal protein S9